ncbi:MAG: hypothetical protein M0R17_08230 [Candidatus Omnitrophica bacterium]|jgi:hypothetical protein|nr:hypothetical protein [Candidatus Omnitrophota bacterium]
MIIKIKFKGIDSWNRPVFKNIESNSHYGSVTTLFDYEDDPDKIIAYFKENIHELEYFGGRFDCEPHGGLDSRIKLEIVN